MASTISDETLEDRAIAHATTADRILIGMYGRETVGWAREVSRTAPRSGSVRVLVVDDDQRRGVHVPLARGAPALRRRPRRVATGGGGPRAGGAGGALARPLRIRGGCARPVGSGRRPDDRRRRQRVAGRRGAGRPRLPRPHGARAHGTRARARRAVRPEPRARHRGRSAGDAAPRIGRPLRGARPRGEGCDDARALSVQPVLVAVRCLHRWGLAAARPRPRLPASGRTGRGLPRGGRVDDGVDRARARLQRRTLPVRAGQPSRPTPA